MSKPLNHLTKHLSDVDEGYFQHMRQGISFAMKMLFAGFACLIHAFAPFVFTHTAGTIVINLQQEMSARKGKSA